MGRPRNDSAVQKAKGNSHRPSRETDRIDAAAPPGTPERPAFLKGRALEIWHEMIGLLLQIPDLLTVVDGKTIADFCQVSSQKESIERGMDLECNHAADTMTAEAEAAVTVKDKKAARKAKRKLAESIEIAQAKIAMGYQGILEKLRMRQNALANELGMSPRSRSQIKVRAPGYVPQADPSALKKIHVSDPSLFGGGTGLVKMQ